MTCSVDAAHFFPVPCLVTPYQVFVRTESIRAEDYYREGSHEGIAALV